MEEFVKVFEYSSGWYITALVFFCLESICFVGGFICDCIRAYNDYKWKSPYCKHEEKRLAFMSCEVVFFLVSIFCVTGGGLHGSDLPGIAIIGHVFGGMFGVLVIYTLVAILFECCYYRRNYND